MRACNGGGPVDMYRSMHILCAAGCDVDAQDDEGNTALLRAISSLNSHRPHIELLLRYGADASLANHCNVTPLWQAVHHRSHCSERHRLFELLLASNACLDTACRGDLLFTSGLISHYCYENAMTPLEVALDGGLYQIARLLLLAGARVTSDVRQQALNGESADSCWLRDLISNPRGLQQSCRLVIRALLGKRVQELIVKLHIPQSLHAYLRFYQIPYPDPH